MGDFDESFIHTLAQQSWALYGVGMFLILLRMYYASQTRAFLTSNAHYRYARIHRLGVRGLQTDDYLMVLAGVSVLLHLSLAY